MTKKDDDQKKNDDKIKQVIKDEGDRHTGDEDPGALQKIKDKIEKGKK